VFAGVHARGSPGERKIIITHRRTSLANDIFPTAVVPPGALHDPSPTQRRAACQTSSTVNPRARRWYTSRPTGKFVPNIQLTTRIMKRKSVRYQTLPLPLRLPNTVARAKSKTTWLTHRADDGNANSRVQFRGENGRERIKISTTAVAKSSDGNEQKYLRARVPIDELDTQRVVWCLILVDIIVKSFVHVTFTVYRPNGRVCTNVFTSFPVPVEFCYIFDFLYAYLRELRF